MIGYCNSLPYGLPKLPFNWIISRLILGFDMTSPKRAIDPPSFTFMKSEASFYKTYSLYNFYFERVLRFVIEYA